MTKKKTTPGSLASRSVTADRAARLYKLIQMLEAGPQTRAALNRRLKLDVRGFYRDLEFLRSLGIQVSARGQKYHLDHDKEAALDALPFPDPGLTIGEARQLFKGKTALHKRLQAQLAAIVG